MDFLRSVRWVPAFFLLAGTQCSPPPPPGTDHAARVDFRRGPDGWVRATHGSDGSRSFAPTSPDEVPAQATDPDSQVLLAIGGLFRPYQAYPTGAWPEAVAVGDLNGDGLSDVVIATSAYADPANDNRIHVFLQGA